MCKDEPELFPVYCAKCGRYLATVMACARVLCCSRWHKPGISEIHDNNEDQLKGGRKNAI